MGFSFASPGWLWTLLLLPAAATLAALAGRRDRERVARLVSRELWPRVLRGDAEIWGGVRLGLALLGAACLVLALARPQWGIVREKVEREGVDVVLALDTSGSMATEDVPPNRLFLARAALSALVARLEGDRFALLAFEGEAYPLVPLTLDADAIGLFLETIEPGTVPAPGTSLGQGLARGLDLFVDQGQRNKVMVLVSDGEDLEGEVDAAVSRAQKLGVVVYTVGVGTEQGQPVPSYDRNGERSGFKHAEDGSVVVSHLNMSALDAIARATGGRSFRLTPQDVSLAGLASAIEGLEQKSVAREFSYRLKERFQIPLGTGLGCLALAPLLPLRWRRAEVRRKSGRILRAAGVALVTGFAVNASAAEPAGVVEELLLKPRRVTAAARKAYEEGNQPLALAGFEEASRLRPGDARARFNLADGLYKQGKYDDAARIYEELASQGPPALRLASRFNLGNALYQKQDYARAVSAYRDVLRAKTDDQDARQNLELALAALKRQQQEQKRQRQPSPQPTPQNGAPKQQPGQPSPQPTPSASPRSEEQKERERFEREAGMPKERAMQLLDALQRNERAEQRKALAAKRAERKGTKDW